MFIDLFEYILLLCFLNLPQTLYFSYQIFSGLSHCMNLIQVPAEHNNNKNNIK